ncbi:uncharacterized protein LOC117117771 [Anneissia japonica]|uniref:uncharacterized protein LOC117117771 n=1 Tax=Anneissia japonica TaxID=1529436 RepID=UPI0014256315|nr:uncharacterized protein LOC117117771 [Anneissia japonica]
MTHGSQLKPAKNMIETLRSSPQIIRRKLFPEVANPIQSGSRAVFDLFYLGREEITTLQLSHAINAVRGTTMERKKRRSLKSKKCKLRINDSMIAISTGPGNCENEIIELHKIAYCALDQRFPSVVLIIARQSTTDKLFVHMLLCGKTEEAANVVRTMELTFQAAWEKHVQLETNDNENNKTNTNETMTRRKHLITLAAIGNNSVLKSSVV